MRLFNTQLIGMLLGGFLWGMIGDKIGRLQVLFGSIILYSLANLANSFVTTTDAYMLCRFISGFGLAGEVGAAITLVAELMSKNARGIGTTIVATAGTSGAVTAGLTGHLLPWRTSFIIGGVLGLFLLILRVRVRESGLFSALKTQTEISRGDLKLLFSSRTRAFKYLTCVLAGTPLFFTMYVMLTFAPEVGKGLGIQGELNTAEATLYFGAAMIVGDFVCGLVSQYFKNRKKVLFSFVGAAFVFTAILLSLNGATAQTFYLLCMPTGFFIGYWAVYITTVTEQFGTNLRSTITTSALNLVRATPIIMISLFLKLKDSLGIVGSMQVVGLLAFICSFFFLSRLKETFGEDLNFVEE